MSVVDMLFGQSQDGQASEEQVDAEEPEANVSVPQQGGQVDAISGKDLANYNPYVDYKPEGSDADIKAVDEEQENSDAEYAKMKLP